MPTEFRMPKLGESVVEGTISRWLKRPGERVERYEPLLEVQTDKVDTEVPAPVAGVVRQLAVPEGATVKVGTLIAVLDDDEAGQQPPAPTSVAQPAAAERAKGARFISPVVARMAAEHRLDLTQIDGTGIGGRVSKQDVERYLARRRFAANDRAAPEPSAAAALEDEAELLPISPMRRAIAEHMERSVRTAPHVTTVMEADMAAVLAHRERSRAEFERQGARLTLTAYLVQAVVAGIQAVPQINSAWTERGIARYRQAHIGVAVALDDGLIVPVLRDAGARSLLGLAQTLGDLTARARAGRLQPGEAQGGTFTITNHGVGGSLLATPIINQPQSAILGVGAVQKRAVVISRDGVDSIAIRPMCYLSLTFDHRVLDGALADAFLSRVRRALETYPG